MYVLLLEEITIKNKISIVDKRRNSLLTLRILCLKYFPFGFGRILEATHTKGYPLRTRLYFFECTLKKHFLYLALKYLVYTIRLALNVFHLFTSVCVIEKARRTYNGNKIWLQLPNIWSTPISTRFRLGWSGFLLLQRENPFFRECQYSLCV